MEKEFNKDYTEKIKNKIDLLPELPNKKQTIKAINSMIILLNYCFLKKNNFFIDNFNNHVIKTIWKVYNTLKTNIIIDNKKDLFEGINSQELKSIRFIISNVTNKYDYIKENNSELCSLVSVNSLKRCLVLINAIIQKHQN